MYPISNAAKALFDAEYRQLIRITGRDKYGSAINITEANVMQGGFGIDRYSCNGEKLEIGTAIASEMTLTLDNRLGQFDNIYFEGAELFVEIGVANWDADLQTWTTNTGAIVQDNNGQTMQFNVADSVYWIPCGYFTPDEQPRRLSTITLHALDRMTRFDIVQHALLPWTDNYGNVITNEQSEPIYLCAEIAFPATIKSIIEQMCMICAVPLATDLTTLPGYDYVIDVMPEAQVEVTFRNMIQWCAGIMASNAWIDWNGALNFSWYNNSTNYVTTIENRFDSDVYENSIQITGVKFTDTDEDKTVYLAGTDTYALDLSGNGLIDATSASSVLNGVYEVVHNFAYRPFTATVVCAPYLWPMDRIVYADKEGDTYVTLITNINFTVNNSTTISATGETLQTNSYSNPGSFTQQQASIIQKLRRVVASDLTEAVDNATNFITGADGGFVRFIYDENDSLTEIVIMDTDDISTATKVWRWNSGGLGYSENGYAGPYTLAMTQDGSIVADFITSGTMSANIIRAGILTDSEGRNFWDLDNGIFRLAGDATLDGRSVTKLIQDVDATISSVDVEFAQNQSSTVAPETGWSTTAPAWASGYYIWQRTKTVSPSGVTYSEPTCISGRDGSASTPGLNQATVYLYKRADTQPAKPSVDTTYVFLSGVLSPIPDGWTRSVPNGSEPCWITSAQAISTETMDTIAANEWLTPTKLVENGSDGSSVDTITDYYAVGNSTTPPADSEFWQPNVAAEWTDNFGNVITASGGSDIEFMPPAVPVPTEVDPYVWQYQLTTYTDGTSLPSNKYISSVLGATGVGVSEIIEEYYLSTSSTEQIGGEWSVEQPAWVRGTYIWTHSVVTWTDGKVTTTTPVLAQAINGANANAENAIDLANEAITNANNLDANLNQTGVFNRLTNNGETQGIYLENNQLYINGTYIKTGTIDSARIAAGSLTINQLDDNAKSAIITGVAAKTQYYLSTSSSQTTGGSWTDAMPSWVSGTYVWTRTVTTKNYADGSESSTASAAIYDNNLTDALSIASSAQSTANSAVSSVAAKTQYYLSTSSSSAIGGIWQDNVPAWSSGTYVWTRTATTITPITGSASTDYSTAVYDANLTTALSTATQAQQSANNAVVSTSVKMQYYLSTSNTATTGGTWQDTVPAWSTGTYIWTRVATTKTIGTGASSTSYSASVYDANMTSALSTAASAVTAANSAVQSTVSVYYRSTTDSTPAITPSTSIGTTIDTSNVWTYVMPRPKNGCYFYTCERYVHVDNTVTFSTVRSIANANYTSLWCSANDASYIDGANIYAGSVTADQIAAGTISIQNFSSAAQAALVGASTTKTQYYLSLSSASAVGGEWQDTTPQWEDGKYVWTRVATTVTLANNSTVTSYSTAVYDWNLTYALSTSTSALNDASAAQSAANSAIKSTTVKAQYYLSTSASEVTGGTWQDTVPSWSSGKYVWTRVTTTVTPVSGSPTTVYSNAVYDTNLTTALSTAATASSAAQTAQNTANSAVGSTSVKTQYYLSTSSSSASGSTWGDSIPAWIEGRYLWTRVATTTTPISGTSTTTYTPSVNGAYDRNLTTALSTSSTAASNAETALANASAAQGTASAAAYREQTVYISKASGTSTIGTITTWVTDTSGNQNTWTTKRPVYSTSYPVLFVALQRQTMAQSGGYDCSCTAPVVDQTTTVIDGGHITTGSIDAGLITSGRLDCGYLTVTNLSASSIYGGTLRLGGASNIYGILQIVNQSGVVVGEWNRNGIIVKSGTIQDASGTHSWNLSTGAMNIGGIFTSTGTDSWGRELKVTINNGAIRFSYDGDEVMEIGYEEIAGGNFSIHPIGSSTNVKLDAITTNSSGEINGGSSVEVYKDGTIWLTGSRIVVGEADEIGQDGLNGTFTLASGDTIEVKNGIVIDIR